MDIITLRLIFEDSEGKISNLRFNDIRADITTTEISEFADKIINENFISVKGKSLVKFVNAEKITTEKMF